MTSLNTHTHRCVSFPAPGQSETTLPLCGPPCRFPRDSPRPLARSGQSERAAGCMTSPPPTPIGYSAKTALCLSATPWRHGTAPYPSEVTRYRASPRAKPCWRAPETLPTSQEQSKSLINKHRLLLVVLIHSGSLFHCPDTLVDLSTAGF